MSVVISLVGESRAALWVDPFKSLPTSEGIAYVIHDNEYPNCVFEYLLWLDDHCVLL